MFRLFDVSGVNSEIQVLLGPDLVSCILTAPCNTPMYFYRLNISKTIYKSKFEAISAQREWFSLCCSSTLDAQMPPHNGHRAG